MVNKRVTNLKKALKKRRKRVVHHTRLYGLLDTKTNTWMGSNDYVNGKPILNLYENKELADIAARIMDYMVGFTAGRIRAKKYDDSAVRIRDTLKVVCPAEVVIKQLEEGIRI